MNKHLGKAFAGLQRVVMKGMAKLNRHVMDSFGYDEEIYFKVLLEIWGEKRAKK